jgi:hypothetical protein
MKRIAGVRAQTVRAWTLSFEKNFSIGLKSGELAGWTGSKRRLCEPPPRRRGLVRGEIVHHGGLAGLRARDNDLLDKGERFDDGAGHVFARFKACILYPPILAGSALPVVSLRLTIWIAVDWLTMKRCAVARRDIPSSSAGATILFRKSIDVAAIPPSPAQCRAAGS